MNLILAVMKRALDDGLKLGVMKETPSGLRLGELLALKWENVNLKEKTIRVNKTVCKTRGEGATVYNI